MTHESSDTPHFDPARERGMLLGDLVGQFCDNRAVSAYYISDQLDVITVLRGTLEPFRNESGVMQVNTPVTLLGKTAMADNHKTWAALSFSTLDGPVHVYEIDRNPNRSEPQHLSEVEAELDNRRRYLLNLAHFDGSESDRLADALFGAPLLDTKWHGILGISAQVSPRARY